MQHYKKENILNDVFQDEPQVTDSASTKNTFSLTLHNIRASNLVDGFEFSKIVTISKKTIDFFLKFEGYALTYQKNKHFIEANLRAFGYNPAINFKYSDRMKNEYIFSYSSREYYNISWVLALNDTLRKKIFVFKIPAQIDILTGDTYHGFDESGSYVSLLPRTTSHDYPQDLIIPAGDPNFPCGEKKIELKQYLDKTYTYEKIFETDLQNNLSILRNPISISCLNTVCNVDNWFDVFCRVLDILYISKPKKFVSRLKRFLFENKFSTVEPREEKIYKYYCVKETQFWVLIPQTQINIVVFLKEAFAAFDIPTNQLTIEFFGDNPFTNLDDSVDPDEVKYEELYSTRAERAKKAIRKAEITARNSQIHETNLYDAPDLSGRIPAYIVYKGEKYPLTSWKEFLKKVYSLIDNECPSQLRDLASHNIHLNPSSIVFLSLDKDFISEVRRSERLPNSGAYFIAEAKSANDALNFIEYVFNSLNIDPKNLTIVYRGYKGYEQRNKPTILSYEGETAETYKRDRKAKSRAELINSLKQNGYTPRGFNIVKSTYARMPRACHIEIKPCFFENDLTLVFDDLLHKKSYIFEIPQGSIDLNDLKWVPDRAVYSLYVVTYGDLSFSDRISRNKKIRLKKYLTAELQYPGESISRPQKVWNSDSEAAETNDIIVQPLSDIPDDFKNHSLIYFSFAYVRYQTSDWKDVLDVIVNYLYGEDPNKIYSLAHYNTGLDFEPTPNKKQRCPFFSLDKNAFTDEDCPHHILNTDIYYKTNYDIATIINKCIKGLLGWFGGSHFELTFAYC